MGQCWLRSFFSLYIMCVKALEMFTLKLKLLVECINRVWHKTGCILTSTVKGPLLRHKLLCSRSCLQRIMVEISILYAREG